MKSPGKLLTQFPGVIFWGYRLVSGFIFGFSGTQTSFLKLEYHSFRLNWYSLLIISWLSTTSTSLQFMNKRKWWYSTSIIQYMSTIFSKKLGTQIFYSSIEYQTIPIQVHIHPDSSTHHPNSSTHHPDSSTHHPDSSTHHPDSRPLYCCPRYSSITFQTSS